MSFVLLYVTTDAYGSLRFSASFSASLLLTLLHSGAIPPLVVKTRGLNEDFSMSITLWLHLSFFSLHVVDRSLLGTSQDMTVRYNVWSLCQRKFSHSYSTVLSQIYPTLHCQQYWFFFHSRFWWLAEVWFWSEHLYRPLSLSVPEILSLSCASLKCSYPFCIWDCDPQSLPHYKHSGWACLSPSIHISCREHLWILVCLVHIQ